MLVPVASPIIGAAIPRPEGVDKVTGRERYAADFTLPGTLWGKVLRSPLPHARIVRVDASGAWKVPGVRAVLTGADVAGQLMGKVMRDMPILCWDRVRYVGDRVTAVAAETREAAETAIAAIEVEYEELPAVFDPLLAMADDAPLLHDDIAGYEGAPRDWLAPDVHNGQSRLAWNKGDVEQGFGAADRVFEHTFRIPSRHQGYIEPHASLVAVDDDGRIQVWASTKAPFRVRTQLANAIGVPEADIRVNVTAVGGDFGGKGDALDAPIAYYLARQTGRPVKIVMTYADELTASNPSHPTVVTVRSGVSRDGRILARSVRTVHACGAYAAMKPNGVISSWHWAGTGYRVPHASVEFLQVYTNTTPGGYFRGPGAHQYTFAIESHTDIIARELGIDPAEFRLRNLMEPGEADAIGQEIRVIKAREILQAALDAAGYEDGTGVRTEAPSESEIRPDGVLTPQSSVLSPQHSRRGRGIAVFGQQIGGGPGGAVLTARPDGSLTLLIPTIDQGSGAATAMRQLAAAEMGLPVDRVRVVVGDTDTAPFDDGSRASRVTYTEGQAVLQACRELQEQLAGHAAELLDARSDETDYRDGAFRADGRAASLAEVVALAGHGQPVSATVNLNLPQPHDVMYFCAQVADVEVDEQTGEVHLLRLVTAHDVGTIINPLTHQGQIDGSVATGIGLALAEELVSEEGRIVNAHLGEYKLPTAPDLPPLQTVLVPSDGGSGPYGSKAIGELGNNVPAAAIANAVADAIGVRVYELPVTAERILAARTP
jgi:CO/xanthine dehydrogenase Mo-binding subunit